MASRNSNTDPQPPTDPFFDIYNRGDGEYGDAASRPLVSYLNQCGIGGGRALDLGAGAGRDALFLASKGCHVTAVDQSERGLQRITDLADQRGLGDNIHTVASDVRRFTYRRASWDVIVATTILDHIPAADAAELFPQMAASLTEHGVLYVEVHTTEDPGSGRWPGNLSDMPVSETASWVGNYFEPNQLASMVTGPDSNLRMLHYEERLEWDQTHGPEHGHGKAIVIAVRRTFHPQWFGMTREFPRP